jgi:hypothetical protein
MRQRVRVDPGAAAPAVAGPLLLALGAALLPFQVWLLLNWFFAVPAMAIGLLLCGAYAFGDGGSSLGGLWRLMGTVLVVAGLFAIARGCAHTAFDLVRHLREMAAFGPPAADHLLSWRPSPAVVLHWYVGPIAVAGGLWFRAELPASSLALQLAYWLVIQPFTVGAFALFYLVAGLSWYS